MGDNPIYWPGHQNPPPPPSWQQASNTPNAQQPPPPPHQQQQPPPPSQQQQQQQQQQQINSIPHYSTNQPPSATQTTQQQQQPNMPPMQRQQHQHVQQQQQPQQQPGMYQGMMPTGAPLPPQSHYPHPQYSSVAPNPYWNHPHQAPPPPPPHWMHAPHPSMPPNPYHPHPQAPHPYYGHPASQPPPPHYAHPMQHPAHPSHPSHPQQGPPPPLYGHPTHPHQQHPSHQHPSHQHPPHPQQGPPPPHPQQGPPPPPHPQQGPPPPHPQQQPPHPHQQQPPPPGQPPHYSHGPHPHQIPPHPQQQQQQPPPPLPPQAQMSPHYPHQHPPHPHPQQQPPPPPHWVHGPSPHQQPAPQPHQQHMMPHPPQPTYYQPAQHPYAPPVPVQQMIPQPQMMPQQQLPPPVSSPHHPPSRTHTPQHLPQSQTPTRVSGPAQNSTPASPSIVPKIEKKEIVFPKNSVEATKPTATKKRKITSKDITDVELWRLLMCLKSGLLAESSWAIDVLSILLNDDSTLMYFNLKEMPGLLEAILEHFKCCLNKLYDGIVSDTTLKPVLSEIKPNDKLEIKLENGVTNNKNFTTNNNNPNVTNNNVEKTNSTPSKKSSKKNVNGVNNNNDLIIQSRGEQMVMFNSVENYTSKTRDGKIVKLKNGVNIDEDDSTYELVYKPVGYSHWQEGNGEDTSHIQVYLECNSFAESSKRCTCISTILRNLSFIPGNDSEMSKHAGLILILGRLLLLKQNEIVPSDPESTTSEWHLLNSLREDTLVIISNISSSLDLSPFNDKINLSLLDGLLHWACSLSSYALDPFPSPSMTVSPQRLALESLAKLSINEENVDLILATPPWSRIEKLFEVLARLLNITEDQTIREFSLVLLSNLTSADSGIARKVALTGAAIPRLLTFLETSISDSETFSTTQDMLRRAATTLKSLSQLVDNHPLFVQHQQRLLNLVMSPRVDQKVAPIIADVIFEISLSD